MAITIVTETRIHCDVCSSPADFEIVGSVRDINNHKVGGIVIGSHIHDAEEGLQETHLCDNCFRGLLV